MISMNVQPNNNFFNYLIKKRKVKMESHLSARHEIGSHFNILFKNLQFVIKSVRLSY